MRFQPLVAAAVLSLTIVPSSALGWGFVGTTEPDSSLDQGGGWMFQGVDVSPNQATRHVYLDAFLAGPAETAVSPNAALIGSSIVVGNYGYWALLGVWKDCNRDGVVGLADQGVTEYRAELLLDTSVCPREPTPSPIPRDWFPSHNDGTWVRELIPLQWLELTTPPDPKDASLDANPFNANDNGARVWIDEGVPGEAHVAAGSCHGYPPPTGSLRSTGGLLNWEDCFDQYRQTDAIDMVAMQNGLLSPISFDDASRDQAHSRSAANLANPWGNERDATAVDAWDCDQAPLAQETLRDPTEESSSANDGLIFRGTIIVNVSAPRVPPVVGLGGSPAGTANATGSGFDRCWRNDRNDRATQASLLPGHAGDALANAPYALEGTASNLVLKASTVNMVPVELDRSISLFGLLGSSAPPNLGIPIGGNDQQQLVFSGTDVTDVTGAPFPSFNSPGTGGDGLWYAAPSSTATSIPAATSTYAFVSPSAVSSYGLTLPKGTAVGSYAVEVCGAGNGQASGWDCDATHWYRDANGKDISPRSHYLGRDPTSTLPCSPKNDAGCLSYGARPGEAFNLRDVDCYDESFNGARQNGITYQQLTNPVFASQSLVGQVAPSCVRST